MNLKFLYFFLMLLALLQNANARTKTLLNMKTDDGKGFYYVFKVGVDDYSGRLTNFIIDKNQINNNLTVEQQIFDANFLKQGIVILKKKGHNIVKISSVDFDYFTGGKIRITYLKNALTKNHNSFDMDLGFENRDWAFLSDNEENIKRSSRKVNELFFESEKVLLVGTVGIKHVIIR